MSKYINSEFTPEEYMKAQEMVKDKYHDPKSNIGPRWVVTGESGGVGLFFYGHYVCFLKDFEHFERLWKELNVSPLKNQ